MGSVRVAWGDGQNNTYVVPDPPAPWSLSESHTYATAGTYSVVITGALDGTKTLSVTVSESDPVAFGLGAYGTGAYGR